MTTYNTLTIANTTAAPVHLGMMLTALEQHAGWTAEVTEFDGEPLAHGTEWHRVAPPKGWFRSTRNPPTPGQRQLAQQVQLHPRRQALG